MHSYNLVCEIRIEAHSRSAYNVSVELLSRIMSFVLRQGDRKVGEESKDNGRDSGHYGSGGNEVAPQLWSSGQ